MVLTRRRSTFAALLVAGAFSMEFLDSTVLATALPQMARSFGMSAVDLHVGITSYLLALAIFIPISGWLAGRFGGRTVFGSAIAIFTVASVGCGLSRTLTQFVIARLIQGAGGAMMVPVGRLVVLRSTEKKDLMKAIAYITWPALLAPIVGPPLGGFITDHASWRWIFIINVPLGVIGYLLTQVLIPNDRPVEHRRLDWPGFFLTSGACALVMYALDLAGSSHVPLVKVGGLFIGGLALGIFGVRHALSHPTPLLELTACRVRTFAISTWGGATFRVVISAIPFLLPLFFQLGFGMDAFASGSLVLAVFAGNLAMKPLTTPLLRRFGFRTVLIANGIGVVLTTMACGFLSAGQPRGVIMVVLFVSGLCRSLQLTSLSTLSFADVPSSAMAGASTLSSMVQQIFTGFGVAIAAILLSVAAQLHSSTQALPTSKDFQIAFLLLGLVAVAGVIECFKLERTAGADVSGHRTNRSLSTN